jgi:hypothetical protein
VLLIGSADATAGPLERVYGVARIGEEVVAGAGDDDGMSFVLGADAVVFARVCGMFEIRAMKFELDDSEACEARFSSNDKRGGNNTAVVTIHAARFKDFGSSYYVPYHLGPSWISKLKRKRA